MRFLAACAIASLGLWRAPGFAQPDVAKPPATRVLFIGNSLTAANDLPRLVESLAAAVGDRLQTRTIAFPDHSLEDHWNRGDARRAIAEGGWSVVVLQQGPSALPESRVLLRDYTRRFDREVTKVGARTALYMVWPSSARRGDFDGVVASYSLAARDIGGLLFPVGDAWRAAWRRESTLALYAQDGFHPSALGSYLAALVMYQQLSGRSPLDLPVAIGPPPVARLLQEAAAEVNRRGVH